MQLKLLPEGTFEMGSASEDIDATPHTVTLTRPFYLGVHQVTQEQYQKVMGENPSGFEGPQNPVEKVSWEDAVEFCRRLSTLPEEKAAGRVYRLPSEAEWEYACRAGSTTEYCFGDSQSQLNEYAWHHDNSGKRTHPVGKRKPNAWGLYDMHGNVWEWCWDWLGDYPKGSVTDPTGPTTDASRVDRGGSYDIHEDELDSDCEVYWGNMIDFSETNPTGPTSGSARVSRGGSWGPRLSCRSAFRGGGADFFPRRPGTAAMAFVSPSAPVAFLVASSCWTGPRFSDKGLRWRTVRASGIVASLGGDAMARTRCRFDAGFKATVALVVIKGSPS
ncbi:MAG: formylglycine-generating enzyme family protein [Pirellulales bacterium]